MWAGGCKVRNGSSGGDGGRGEGVGKSDTANVSENLAPCNHIWMQLQKFRRDLMSHLGSCVGCLLLQSAPISARLPKCHLIRVLMFL